jgi:hypothetical protein
VVPRGAELIVFQGGGAGCKLYGTRSAGVALRRLAFGAANGRGFGSGSARETNVPRAGAW